MLVGSFRDTFDGLLMNGGERTIPMSVTETLLGQLADRALQALGLAEPAEATRLLLATTDRGQTAGRLAEAGFSVDLFEPEYYRFLRCSELLVAGAKPQVTSEHGLARAELTGCNGRLRLLCQADPPGREAGPGQLGVEELEAGERAAGYSVTALALRRDGSAEWARDLLQGFAGRLAPDGALVVVVDHPDDQWVGDHLRQCVRNAKSVKRIVSGGGDEQGATGYWVQAGALKVRHRDFRCQFAFRDQQRLIQAVSRPGVFSHRKLDLGARRLMDAMELPETGRLLDLGCGSGVVALTAALRHPGLQIDALDSAARAVDCTNEGARINGVADRLRGWLSACDTLPSELPYDVVVANPPYFAQLQIAELFLATAQRALGHGGVVWVVGKQPEWYQTHAPRWFDRVRVQTVGGGYCVVSGIRAETS